jgi:hypothetical protein
MILKYSKRNMWVLYFQEERKSNGGGQELGRGGQARVGVEELELKSWSAASNFLLLLTR